MNTYRAALVGLGRIASLLEDDTKREKPASHAGALTAHGGFEIVGGCDLDAERRDIFGKRWGLPSTALFESPDALLAAVKPDLFVVATYPDTHAPLVKLAIKHKIPLVICEKPLTPDAASSRRLIRLCEQSDTRLMVNHERRYARDYQRAQRQIQAQTYGQLLSVFAKIYMGYQRTPAEVLFWDGTHMLDILRFLTGKEITGIRAWGQKDKKGGFLMTKFQLGETPVVMEIGTTRDHLAFEMDLSFERGRIRIGNGLYEESLGGVSPHYDKMRSLLPVAVPEEEIYPTGYFSGMIADAYRVLKELSETAPAESQLELWAKPISQGRDGWKAVAAIEEILHNTKKV